MAVPAASASGSPRLSLAGLLRASSRTFAIGIEQLPGELREAVRTAYLLLRVSDYLEDDRSLPAGEKVRLLRLWDAVLAGEAPVASLLGALPLPDPPTPDALVAAQADDVVAALAALPAGLRDPVVRHVRDSTQGMARWVAAGPRVRTEDDLDDYMHEVAGRVGYLLTDLFSACSPAIAARRSRLEPLAREFGLALQTVNVIRGLRDDFERGWIFVPDSFVEDLGIARAQLFDPLHREAAMSVLGRLVAKGERHLAAAVEYTCALPRRERGIRLFCLLPLLFAIRTLALSRGNHAVFAGEAKLSRREVSRIVRRASLMGWANRWIRWYAGRLAERA